MGNLVKLIDKSNGYMFAGIEGSVLGSAKLLPLQLTGIGLLQISLSEFEFL